MAKVKKGDTFKEKRIGGGFIVSTCKGFVVYTKHQNPTNTVEITINKDGNYAFNQDSKIFSTEDLAKDFAKKHQSKYKNDLKVRPYYSEKITK